MSEERRLPSVSVVVPCYNYAGYVAEALESVLLQDVPALEVLAINDGSSDRSLEILRAYESAGVRVIDQPNQGHIACVNRGLRETAGDLILFLDADDRLEPGALRKISEAYRPDAAKVQFDLKILDAHGHDLGRRFCHFPTGYGAEEVRSSFERTGTYRWPVTVGNAYARWFLKKVFPLEIDDAPDGLLNTIAPVYGEVVVVPEALGAYRIHGQNRWATRGRGALRLAERIAIRRRELESLKQHATREGVTLPHCDPLDFELAFVNYRLMAKRLGLAYEGAERDQTGRLVGLGLRAVLRERYPLRARVAHLSWFLALGGAPGRLSEALIALRFNRDRYRDLWRRAWRSESSTKEAEGT